MRTTQNHDTSVSIYIVMSHVVILIIFPKLIINKQDVVRVSATGLETYLAQKRRKLVLYRHGSPSGKQLDQGIPIEGMAAQGT